MLRDAGEREGYGARGRLFTCRRHKEGSSRNSPARSLQNSKRLNHGVLAHHDDAAIRYLEPLRITLAINTNDGAI